jgi:acetoin utilization protein AcuB
MIGTVRDYMASKVQTLTPDDSMDAAMVLVRSRRIRHIPIVENGSLVGIVTDRDLKRVMPSPLTGADQATYEMVAETTTVRQIMTRSPTTIAPEAPLREAVRILCDRKFGALPVVADGVLVGIITETDLLRAFLRILEAQS